MPMLLVAVEDVDKRFTKLLGDNFGFQNLQWEQHAAPPGYDGELVRSLDEAPVGLLAWRKDRPGLEFIRRVAPGLGISLILIATLTFLLILWGNRQAKRLVESEEHATAAARTDPLTDLLNRFGLREAFARSSARQSQSRHRWAFFLSTSTSSKASTTLPGTLSATRF